MSEQTTELSDAKRAALSEMIDSYALAFHAAIVRPESHKKMKAKAESIMDAILDRALAAPTAPAPTEPVAQSVPTEVGIAWQSGATWPNERKAVTVDGNTWYRHDHPKVATPPSAAQPESVGDRVTIAGLESAVNHLSAMFDEQRRLLVEVEQVCGRDAYGIEFEDGDSELIDKVRAHLAATTSDASKCSKSERGAFEGELRKQCFQKPTPEAYDLAWSMWSARAAQPEAVGEVLFDEAFGCKAGQLYVNLPVGTKLYTAIAPAQRVASEREAFEAKLKEQWPHADYAFDGAEYESAAVQCAWAAWMWRAAAPTTETTSSPSDAERLDAARYRWLRDFYSPPDDEPWDNIDCAFVRGGEELDAAIDADIATKGGKL